MIGTIGDPGCLFNVTDAAVFNHTEGQPREIEIRSNGVGLRFFLDGVPVKLNKAGYDPLPVPAELRGSTLHGFAVDTHCVDPYRDAMKTPTILDITATHLKSDDPFLRATIHASAPQLVGQSSTTHFWMPGVAGAVLMNSAGDALVTIDLNGDGTGPTNCSAIHCPPRDYVRSRNGDAIVNLNGTDGEGEQAPTWNPIGAGAHATNALRFAYRTVRSVSSPL